MKIRFTGILTLFLAFMVQFSFAQEKTITGTVTSAEDGLPLPGASVVIEGTTRGTRTDLDGKFSIMARQGEKLAFSYVGSKTQVITIGTSDVINVVLSTDNVLETVSLDVYRKTTPRTQSFSAKIIGSEIIEERSNANVMQSLQGQIAGVNISTGSGQPGTTPVIVVRGIGSINGSTDPLFVIDGMPVDGEIFRSLNGNDIKTYTILKDAAATSIYGNRGANGVFVITTKGGSFNQDLQIKYSVQTGFAKMQNLNIELMSSSQLLNFQKLHGVGPGSTMQQWEIDQLAANTNTFWSDVFFRTATTQQHDLSFSSGGERTANYTSLSYLDQEGIFVASALKRFGLRNNFSGKNKSERLNYSLNTNVSFAKTNNLADFDSGRNATYFNPFLSAQGGLPYLSPYDPDGSITTYGPYFPGAAFDVDAAPYVLLNSMKMNRNEHKDLRLMSNFSASYEVIDNVTIGLRLNGDYFHRGNERMLHPKSTLGPFQTSWNPGTQTGAQFGGIWWESERRDFVFNALYSLGYSNTFNSKHNVSVTAFFEYNKAHRKTSAFRQNGLDPRFLGTSDAFIPGLTVDPNTGGRHYVPVVSTSTLTEGLLSYFGSGMYDFDQKYVLNATIRRDASFRFIDSNRWGTFWAVGAAWNIDKESFMDNSDFSYLKLRGSYGTNGNQYIAVGNLGPMFEGLNLTRDLYIGGQVGYNGSVGTIRSQLANRDLVWETVEQINIGLEIGLFGDKLQGSIDVYRKTTKDLYHVKPVSLTNATIVKTSTPVPGQVESNIGSMENKGIELDLTYTFLKNNDWLIKLNANGSYNKNEIKKLHDNFDGIFNIGGNVALAEGQPYDSYYVSRYIGVNPANGNALFLDVDGNPTEQMRDDDRVFQDKSRIPVWQGGFGTLVSYKGFEFSTQWVFMADVYRMNRDYAELMDLNTESLEFFQRAVPLLNAWQTTGDITSVPKMDSSYGSINHINGSDRFLEDASFLRLRNLAFAYSFSKERLNQLPINNLRIFVQAENILTFSGYRGWDVENGFRSTEAGRYPTSKMYSLGMIVNF